MRVTLQRDGLIALLIGRAKRMSQGVHISAAYTGAVTETQSNDPRFVQIAFGYSFQGRRSPFGSSSSSSSTPQEQLTMFARIAAVTVLTVSLGMPIDAGQTPPPQPPAGQPPAGTPGQEAGRGAPGQPGGRGQGRGRGGPRGPQPLPFENHDGFESIFDGRR
jgi:hypothetical protein